MHFKCTVMTGSWLVVSVTYCTKCLKSTIRIMCNLVFSLSLQLKFALAEVCSSSSSAQVEEPLHLRNKSLPDLKMLLLFSALFPPQKEISSLVHLSPSPRPLMVQKQWRPPCLLLASGHRTKVSLLQVMQERLAASVLRVPRAPQKVFSPKQESLCPR